MVGYRVLINWMKSPIDFESLTVSEITQGIHMDLWGSGSWFMHAHFLRWLCSSLSFSLSNIHACTSFPGTFMVPVNGSLVNSLSAAYRVLGCHTYEYCLQLMLFLFIHVALDWMALNNLVSSFTNLDHSHLASHVQNFLSYL